MGILANMLKRNKERDRLAEEYERTDKVVSNVERKKLSHNEREIIGILKKEKEANLKEALRFEEQRRQAQDLLTGRQITAGSDLNLLEGNQGFLFGGNFL